MRAIHPVAHVGALGRLAGPEAAAELFHAIQNIIIRALLAVQPAMIQDKHCFELYGYDVMIDSNLKPWLIEVRVGGAARWHGSWLGWS
jgi:hypothetical protein